MIDDAFKINERDNGVIKIKKKKGGKEKIIQNILDSSTKKRKKEEGEKNSWRIDRPDKVTGDLEFFSNFVKFVVSSCFRPKISPGHVPYVPPPLMGRNFPPPIEREAFHN